MEWFMNWWWATILGPIVLAVVIGYALITRRRLRVGERQRQAEATEQLYRPESKP